jgi:hypothetical protein
MGNRGGRNLEGEVCFLNLGHGLGFGLHGGCCRAGEGRRFIVLNLKVWKTPQGLGAGVRGGGGSWEAASWAACGKGRSAHTLFLLSTSIFLSPERDSWGSLVATLAWEAGARVFVIVQTRLCGVTLGVTSHP